MPRDTPVLPIELLLQLPRNTAQILNQLQSEFARHKIKLNFDRIRPSELADLTRQVNAASAVGKSISSNLKVDKRAIQDVALLGRALSHTTQLSEELGRQTAITAKRFGVYVASSKVLYGLINAFKSATTEAIAFERELGKIAQLRNTSIAATVQTSRLIDSLSTQFGVSALEFGQVATQLAEAGKSISDINNILRAAAPAALLPTFTNLAGNMESLVALMNQFRLASADTAKILDSLNAVSKDFTVSVDELFTGLRRSGAIYASLSNISGPGPENIKALQQYLAQFTSVISVTRESAEVIGTSFRTIFPRLQRTQTREVLRRFDPSLSLDDRQGNFVGPYEATRRINRSILREIGRNPNFTSSKEFVDILEAIGGLRQIGRTGPLLLNFGEAEKARRLAEQGEGSLISDAAKAQGLLQVELRKTREEFNKFIRDVVQSGAFQGFVKSVLSITTTLIRAIDTLTPAIGALSAAGAVLLGTALPGFIGAFQRNLRPARRFGFARGGLVPTLLEPGETVYDPEAVKKYGKRNLETIRQGILRVGGAGFGDRIPAELEAGSFVMPRRKMVLGGLLEEIIKFGGDPSKLSKGFGNLPGGSSLEKIFKALGVTARTSTTGNFAALTNIPSQSVVFNRSILGKASQQTQLLTVADELAHLVQADKGDFVTTGRARELAGRRAAGFQRDIARGLYGNLSPRQISGLESRELKASVIGQAVAGRGETALSDIANLIGGKDADEAQKVTKDYLQAQGQLYDAINQSARSAKDAARLTKQANKLQDRLIAQGADPILASRKAISAVIGAGGERHRRIPGAPGGANVFPGNLGVPPGAAIFPEFRGGRQPQLLLPRPTSVYDRELYPGASQVGPIGRPLSVYPNPLGPGYGPPYHTNMYPGNYGAPLPPRGRLHGPLPPHWRDRIISNTLFPQQYSELPAGYLQNRGAQKLLERAGIIQKPLTQQQQLKQLTRSLTPEQRRVVGGVVRLQGGGLSEAISTAQNFINPQTDPTLRQKVFRDIAGSRFGQFVGRNATAFGGQLTNARQTIFGGQGLGIRGQSALFGIAALGGTLAATTSSPTGRGIGTGLLTGSSIFGAAAATGLNPIVGGIIAVGAAVSAFGDAVNTARDSLDRGLISKEVVAATRLNAGNNAAVTNAALKIATGGNSPFVGTRSFLATGGLVPSARTFIPSEFKRQTFGSQIGSAFRDLFTSNTRGASLDLARIREQEIGSARAESLPLFETRRAQIQERAKELFASGKNQQEIVDTLFKESEGLGPLLALFSDQLKSINTLTEDRAQVESIATGELNTLLEVTKKEIQQRNLINSILANTAAVTADFSQSLSLAEGNLARFQQLAETSNINVQAGFQRIAGADQIQANRTANVFSDIRGLDRDAILAATDNLFRTRFKNNPADRLAGGEILANFQNFQGLASAQSAIINQLRPNIIGRSVQSDTVREAIEREFGRGGALSKLPPAVQQLIDAQLNSALSGANEDLRVSDALASGQLDNILGNLLGGQGERAVGIFNQIQDLVNQNEQNLADRLNAINAADLDNLRASIDNLARGDEFQKGLQQIIGFTPQSFANDARARILRDRQVLQGRDIPLTSQQLGEEISRLRRDDPNNANIPRLIAALQANANETRLLAAINEDIARLNQERQTAAGFLDRLTGNDPEGRRQATNAIAIAQAVSQGFDIPINVLNDNLADLRQIFAQGNEGFRARLGIRGDAIDLEDRIAELQTRSLFGGNFANNNRLARVFGIGGSLLDLQGRVNQDPRLQRRFGDVSKLRPEEQARLASRLGIQPDNFSILQGINDNPRIQSLVRQKLGLEAGTDINQALDDSPRLRRRLSGLFGIPGDPRQALQAAALSDAARFSNSQRDNLAAQFEAGANKIREANNELIRLQKEQIDRQQDLIKQEHDRFLNNLFDVFRGMDTSFQEFNDSVNNIPTKIELGNPTVTVVFPQGNIFNNIAPQLQQMVSNAVKQALQKNPGVGGP